MILIHHVPHIEDFYRIAGAIINRYYSNIPMEGANAETARHLFQRAREPNVIDVIAKHL